MSASHDSRLLPLSDGQSAEWPPTFGRTVTRCLCVALAGTLSLMIFFRADLTSGFTILFGDRFDGFIETALLEHWFSVFTGHAWWSQTDFFYPTPSSLGYNDGYILLGIPYTLWRLFGCDPFLASELTDIIIKLVGFMGSVVFAARCLRMELWAATLGASLFTIANNSYVQGAHVQLFTVAFAPTLATMIGAFMQSLRQRERLSASLKGMCAAVFLAGWLLTAFYMAWFFLIFSLIFGSIAALAFRRDLRSILSDAITCRVSVASTAAVFAIAVAPFFVLYLPKASETGMHRFAEVFGYLSTPFDLLNLTGSSMLYASLQDWLRPVFSPGSEHATGYTPVLLALFVCSSIVLAQRWAHARERLIVCAALATVIFWSLTIHIGHHTVWRLVYDAVPGAKGIRVISRAQIFLQWPLTIVAVSGLEVVVQRSRSRSRHTRVGALACAGFLGLVLSAEQINDWQIPQLYRKSELAWLHSIAPPPSSCRAFYVSRGRVVDKRYGQRLSDLVEHNTSAMIIAETSRLPTVNGFATFLPVDWNLLSIDRPDYRSRVIAYAEKNALHNLCSVDLQTGRWLSVPTDRAASVTDEHRVGRERARVE